MISVVPEVREVSRVVRAALRREDPSSGSDRGVRSCHCLHNSKQKNHEITKVRKHEKRGWKSENYAFDNKSWSVEVQQKADAQPGGFEV
jgi:hypothetical protein